MEKFPDIDIKTRFLVLSLDAGWTSTRISDQLQVSLRTIQDWMKKTNQGKDIRKVGEGRGKKASIPSTLKDKIARQGREAPLKSSTRKIGIKYDIGKSSSNRILIEKGFEYKKVESVYKLDDFQRNERINFCKDMTKWRGRKIHQTFFSDETGFWLSEVYNKKAWQKLNHKVTIEKPKKDVKINVWGAISSNGATSLEIFTCNLKAPKYQEILETHFQEMQELYEGDFYFQHDNHKSHKAVESWMDNYGFNKIKFPSYSPDLSPIENIWATLKESVAKDQPKSERQLVKSIRLNWAKITSVEKLRPYLENLYTRYKLCIDIEGEIVDY